MKASGKVRLFIQGFGYVSWNESEKSEIGRVHFVDSQDFAILMDEADAVRISRWFDAPCTIIPFDDEKRRTND